MTVKNIWSQFDKIVEYLLTLPNIATTFTWGIYTWKPIIQPKKWKYMYLQMYSNYPETANDTNWVYAKSSFINFYIVGNDKNTPDAELYDCLDVLCNAINDINQESIELNWFTIYSIRESSQYWVLKETAQNPYIVAQFTFIYKYFYN